MNADLPQDLPRDAEPPCRVVNPHADAPLLILCDHASNRIPPELGDLGLPEEVRRRHIAWDIGAEDIARHLAERYGARLVLAAWSRLVIDLNRYPDDPAAMPETSDRIPVPGNRGLSRDARERRVEAVFRPYHARIEAEIEALVGPGPPPLVLSIHTMADRLAGGPRRREEINVCRTDDERWAVPVLQTLRADPDLVVGDNVPYAVDIGTDYTIPEHAIRRGLPWLQIEFRQDLVATPRAARAWAERFAPALDRVLTEIALSDDAPYRR